MDTSKLAALSLYEVDRITGLKVGEDAGTDAGRAILEGIRDAVMEAAEEDRWDARSKRGEVIHELADMLVPSYTHEVIRLLPIVAAAWVMDLDGVAAYAAAYDFGNHSYRDVKDTPHDAAKGGLYLAFTEGIRNLVVWLDENEGEE